MCNPIHPDYVFCIVCILYMVYLCLYLIPLCVCNIQHLSVLCCGKLNFQEEPTRGIQVRFIYVISILI